MSWKCSGDHGSTGFRMGLPVVAWAWLWLPGCRSSEHRPADERGRCTLASIGRHTPPCVCGGGMTYGVLTAYGAEDAWIDIDRSAPGRVVGLSDITAIAAGTMHSLAVRSDGTLWA